MNITFLPRFKQVSITEPENVMKIMRKQGIPMDFVCGGNGTCGKCKVLVTKGNHTSYSDAELLLLSEEERAKGYRLACDFQVREDTCIIIEEREEATVKQEQTAKVTGKVQIAFDIGTTTIEAAFLQNTTELVTKVNRVNPQRAYGLDVMSRLSYAIENEEQGRVLMKVILAALNEMIHDFLRDYQAKSSQIDKIVVLGNTTMIHLLLGHPVKKLVTPPFHIDLKAFTAQAKQHGFDVEEDCILMVPSLIGGYVGSDTLGCILATDLWKRSETCAIMDIGTNGELVISRNGKLYACSTAAGPAFEGAGIVQGMRAQKGAIYQVDRTGEDSWKVYTIDEAPAKGVCGSGLVDAVSVLAMCGQIDQTGLMKQRKIALDQEGKVFLYQEDIRQFQLAKAAIRAGFEVLLKEAGVCREELQQIIITGAFGSGVNLENGKACGLFPKVSDNRFRCVDNGSLAGGIKLLQEESLMKQSITIAKNIEHIELANSICFQEAFVKFMDVCN